MSTWKPLWSQVKSKLGLPNGPRSWVKVAVPVVVSPVTFRLRSAMAAPNRAKPPVTVKPSAAVLSMNTLGPMVAWAASW